MAEGRCGEVRCGEGRGGRTPCGTCTDLTEGPVYGDDCQCVCMIDPHAKMTLSVFSLSFASHPLSPSLSLPLSLYFTLFLSTLFHSCLSHPVHLEEVSHTQSHTVSHF